MAIIIWAGITRITLATRAGLGVTWRFDFLSFLRSFSFLCFFSFLVASFLRAEGAAFSWLSSHTVVFRLGGGGGGGSTTDSRRTIPEPAASGCGGMYASGFILSALVRHAISRASCQDTPPRR